MEGKSVKELKAIAKERSVKGYYKMRKAELIEVLSTVNDLVDLGEANNIVYDLVDIREPTHNKTLKVLIKALTEPHDSCKQTNII